jgi:hypothetical protein
VTRDLVVECGHSVKGCATCVAQWLHLVQTYGDAEVMVPASRCSVHEEERN